MLYNTINTASELKEEFIAYDRDYYTYEAYEAILSYFEEVAPDGMELDVIAICCDFNESTLEEIAADYSLDTNYDGWERDALTILQENTWAIETIDNKVLYMAY